MRRLNISKKHFPGVERLKISEIILKSFPLFFAARLRRNTMKTLNCLFPSCGREKFLAARLRRKCGLRRNAVKKRRFSGVKRLNVSENIFRCEEIEYFRQAFSGVGRLNISKTIFRV